MDDNAAGRYNIIVTAAMRLHWRDEPPRMTTLTCRACRRLTEQLQLHHPVGWVQVCTLGVLTVADLELQLQQQQRLSAQAAAERVAPLKWLAQLRMGPEVDAGSVPVAELLQQADTLLLQCRWRQLIAKKAARMGAEYADAANWAAADAAAAVTHLSNMLLLLQYPVKQQFPACQQLSEKVTVTLDKFRGDATPLGSFDPGRAGSAP